MSDTASTDRVPRRSWLMLQLVGLYGLWLREVMRAIRDRGQLIGGVSRPILWVLILGIGLNPYFRGEVYGATTFVVPFTYLQFIFPGVIALNIMFTSVQSAVSVIWDREFGFLREVLVSPLARGTVLLGKILGGATVAPPSTLPSRISQRGMGDTSTSRRNPNSRSQITDTANWIEVYMMLRTMTAGNRNCR